MSGMLYEWHRSGQLLAWEEGHGVAESPFLRKSHEMFKEVAAVLDEVDQGRIRLLIEIFENFGYSGLSAEMRARVTYYHQLGYYAMHVKEILTGDPWMQALRSVDEIRAGMLGEASFQDAWRAFKERPYEAPQGDGPSTPDFTHKARAD